MSIDPNDTPVPDEDQAVDKRQFTSPAIRKRAALEWAAMDERGHISPEDWARIEKECGG